MNSEQLVYWFLSALLMFVFGYVVGLKIRWAKGIVEAL